MSKKARFGLVVEKFPQDTWSFGLTLTHWGEENFIGINIFKWSICIGRLYKE